MSDAQLDAVQADGSGATPSAVLQALEALAQTAPGVSAKEVQELIASSSQSAISEAQTQAELDALADAGVVTVLGVGAGGPLYRPTGVCAEDAQAMLAAQEERERAAAREESESLQRPRRALPAAVSQSAHEGPDHGSSVPAAPARSDGPQAALTLPVAVARGLGEAVLGKLLAELLATADGEPTTCVIELR